MKQGLSFLSSSLSYALHRHLNEIQQSKKRIILMYSSLIDSFWWYVEWYKMPYSFLLNFASLGHLRLGLLIWEDDRKRSESIILFQLADSHSSCIKTLWLNVIFNYQQISQTRFTTWPVWKDMLDIVASVKFKKLSVPQQCLSTLSP